METQWPLIVFTLGVCLCCGLLGALSLLVVRGKGERVQTPALLMAFLSLVIGGLGSFLHLQHWERAFNGFGNITSGITQEMIGCIVLALVMVLWFFRLRSKKPIGKALAWVTLTIAVLVVYITAHSYQMPARPAWGVSLIAFYLGNACLLGTVALWCITAVLNDGTAGPTAVRLSLAGAVAQLIASVVFVAACAAAKIADFGYYLDPTRVTIAPTQLDNLAVFLLAGDGAFVFWSSMACAVVAAVCAIVAQRGKGASRMLVVIAAVVTVAVSVLFRVLIYLVGFPVLLLY